MQLLNVTNLPIYLPYDKAPIPFGDPFTGISSSGAESGGDVWTVPGYVPTAGDVVAFSTPGTGSPSLDASYTVGTSYYVVSPSTDTFKVSATKGGSAISATAGASTDITVHLISNQADGTVQPFKPNNSVVVVNLSGGTLVLQGAADSGQSTPGNGYAPPAGPGSWSTIVSVSTLSMALATLSYDWIRVSTSGTLQLLQN
jgi:hypothetical protein